MVRLHAFAALALAMVAVPATTHARKSASTATLAPPALRLNPTLRLVLTLPAHLGNGCKVCGSGIPDAHIGRNTFLGADGVMDRVRLYVKRDATQWSVDVNTNSALLGYGFRF